MSDEDIYQWWSERAAIMEFDGGRSRVDSEFHAAKAVRSVFGSIPECVREAIGKKQDG